MSGVSMTLGAARHVRDLRLGLGRRRVVHANAMKSAFWPFDDRLRIINEQIKPGYAALKAAALGTSITTVPPSFRT